MSNQSEWMRVHDEATRAFRDGTISAATDEQMTAWLMNICTGAFPNENIRHAEIVRGITINHVQMARLIRGVETTMRDLHTANEVTQRKVTILTAVGIILAVLQAVFALPIWR